MPDKYFTEVTQALAMSTRNLCNFTALLQPMKILRFLVLVCITGSTLFAQQPVLRKFSVQRNAGDGQYMTYEGMQNTLGQEVIPADYDYIWDFTEDSLTLARKLTVSKVTGAASFDYQIISNSGFLYYEFPSYLLPEPAQEGFIRTFNDRTGRYGFLNPMGDVVVKFKYTAARDFREELAAVSDPASGKYGFINRKGQYTIKPQFDEAYSFSEGQAVVKQGERFSFLRKDGSLIPIAGMYAQVFDLQEGFSVVSASRNDSIFYGFINKDGIEILAPTYVFLDNFEGGTAVFVKENEAGMINNTGRVVIEPRYDELYRFDQAHYLFQSNGLKGLLGIDGKTILPASYSAIDLFSDGLCAVNRSDKWGFADTEGNEVIPCQFAEYRVGFVNGKVEVHLPDRWFLVHGSDTLTLPEYDEVLPFYGYAAAFRKDQLWGFLNQKGEESIEPKFDELVYNKGAVVFGKTPQADGSFLWSVIDGYGREVQSERYSEVVRFSDGLAAVRTKDGWGFVNNLGAEIVPPKYDAVRNFSSGRAAVNLNGEWGFINNTGHEEIPVFERMPVFEEEIPKTFSDSVKSIRESFPLFLMEVLGDFNATCACVEDETADNSSLHPLCINKIGKIIPSLVCSPYTHKADLFEPEAELNPSLRLVRVAGRWLTIDKNGTVLN